MAFVLISTWIVDFMSIYIFPRVFCDSFLLSEARNISAGIAYPTDVDRRKTLQPSIGHIACKSSRSSEQLHTSWPEHHRHMLLKLLRFLLTPKVIIFPRSACYSSRDTFTVGLYRLHLQQGVPVTH
jgi:hypothetical protein